MGFNISNLDMAAAGEAGFEWEVTHPASGAKTGFFIKVRGAMSTKVKALQRKRANEYLMRQKVNARKKNSDDDMSIEELEQTTVETAIGRIIGWRGLEDEKGELIPFNQETAERILSQDGFSWLKEEIIEKSDDVTNFPGA